MAEGKVKKDTGSWELSEERISQDESVKIVKLLNFCSVTSYSKDSKNGNGFDNNLTIYSQNDTNFWIEANISNPDGLYLSTPDAAEPDYTQVVYKKMN
jgi:hypothetical protein